ncbi:MAG: hypothetical protein WEG36_05720 [Gemmatimonadota bacterium]
MTRKPENPREGLTRLFGDAARPDEPGASPFGEDSPGKDPISRIRTAVVRLRRVRSQVSAEGLTPAATRTVLDEIVQALEAVAEGLGAPNTPPPSDEDE